MWGPPPCVDGCDALLRFLPGWVNRAPFCSVCVSSLVCVVDGFAAVIHEFGGVVTVQAGTVRCMGRDGGNAPRERPPGCMHVPIHGAVPD